MALAITDVAMSGIRNQMYKKSIKKFELEFDNGDYGILGCAGVRYKFTRWARVTGRPMMTQMARSAGTKGMNNEYRVLMAVRNNKSGTVNFIMMKRPESDGEIVNMTNPLENCSIETSFQNNSRGDMLKATNLKVGIKQPRSKKNKNETETETEKTADEEVDFESISEWTTDDDEEADDEKAIHGLNMFTLENTDVQLLQPFKTIYKIQILDTSDDTISGGWDGKIIKDILIDLKNGMGTKPCSGIKELSVH
jgi:hypothetical protein